jgi:hypothetical protein
MKNPVKNLSPSGALAAAIGLAFVPTASAWEFEEPDEFEPIIEINATDGDIGFHLLLDGEAWRVAKVYDPDGDRMLYVRGTDDLKEQGLTELFFESAEPPCWYEEGNEDVDWDEDEVVDLEEFIDRFEEGPYKAYVRTLEGPFLRGVGEFTHNIPAAPMVEIVVEEDEEDGETEITINFMPGEDLGRCEIPEGLLETHPSEVEVIRWEVVLEPDEDAIDEANEAGADPELVFSKFTVQLPAGATSVEVPEEFFQPYLDAGITEFKGEVGGKEESGNQTFTEIEFDVEEELGAE